MSYTSGWIGDLADRPQPGGKVGLPPTSNTQRRHVPYVLCVFQPAESNVALYMESAPTYS